MSSVIHRFYERAAAATDSLAVVTVDNRWTYGQTAECARRVAAGLREAGIGRGNRVGLFFSHGAEMVGALLGVLHVGASYVPLDAAYPRQRLSFMADDAGIDVLLVGAAQASTATSMIDAPVRIYEDLVASTEPDPHEPVAEAGDEVYVLYTSGSTGTPKAVAQTHRNVLHHAGVWIEGLAITAADRISLQSAFSWDSAVQDTFAALLSGAALYPIDFRALGTAGLLDWLAAERISVYHSTMPIYRALVRTMAARGIRLPALRMLALGGDTIGLADLDSYREMFEERCGLAGAYGSSECSCALLRVATRDYVPPTGVFPLGFAVRETQVRLIDADGRVVEGAGTGEIVVSSAYLAPSAVGQGSDLRTGDLARRLDDGTLLLIGRRDFQVKIAGIRVEPGEVESSLAHLPGVREAVVMPFDDRAGERQLAAYVVAEPEARLSAIELRAALRRVLPDHAVPTAYVLLDTLPLTANHKIDRAALPAPTTRHTVAREAVPRSGLEHAIAEIWCKVLGLSAVGRDDNFFDIGGTSVRAAEIHERLTRTLAPAVTMTDLYRAPTVGKLARLIAGETAPQSPTIAAIDRGRRRRVLQRRIPRTNVSGADL